MDRAGGSRAGVVSPLSAGVRNRRVNRGRQHHREWYVVVGSIARRFGDFRRHPLFVIPMCAHVGDIRLHRYDDPRKLAQLLHFISRPTLNLTVTFSRHLNRPPKVFGGVLRVRDLQGFAEDLAVNDTEVSGITDGCLIRASRRSHRGIVRTNFLTNTALAGTLSAILSINSFFSNRCHTFPGQRFHTSIGKKRLTGILAGLNLN